MLTAPIHNVTAAVLIMDRGIIKTKFTFTYSIISRYLLLLFVEIKVIVSNFKSFNCILNAILCILAYNLNILNIVFQDNSVNLSKLWNGQKR